MLQDGRALLLPLAAATISNAARQGVAEIAVTIDARPLAIAGVVPITGLLNALGSLSVYCPAK